MPDVTMRKWPVDLLHILMLAALLCVTMLGLGKIASAAGWMTFDAVGIAVVLGTGRMLQTATPARAALGRLLLGCLLVPLVFTQVGFVLAEFRDVENAAFLFELDRWMFFGGNPLESLEAMSTPWLTEFMQWGYTAYLILPVASVLVIATQATPLQVSRSVWCLLGGIYISYVGYALVPASGPNIHSNLGPLAPVSIPVLPLYEFADPLPGVWLTAELREWMFHAEPTKRDCFPSGHVAVAIMCAILTTRVSKRHALWAWPLAIIVTASTIYLRYHYVIDVVAGVALAVVATHPFAVFHDKLLWRQNHSVKVRS